jgi:SNF2 family DNA or RNA helicase
MHVLAALTRLRQICCHPALVGSDTASGKTDTLFELARPAGGRRPEGARLQPVRADAANPRKGMRAARNIHTHMLTGQTKDRQQVVSAFQADDPNAACSC